jgi:GT2 family glycosyltransferase/glycosyltransferase involved in cell wall biosynthesis
VKKPRLLVLAKTLPLHDRASGDYRLMRMLEIFAKTFEVDFLSCTHTLQHKKTGRIEYLPRDSIYPAGKLENLDQGYIDDLKKIGVRTLNRARPEPFTIRAGGRFDIRPFLAANEYDLVWVEFYYLANDYIDDIRRFQPQARLVCDSVDLHFRRLARRSNFLEEEGRYLVNARHEKKRARTRSHREYLASERRHADHVRDEELRAYQKCDAVVMVSEDDRDELHRHCPKLEILLVPNIHRMPGARSQGTPFARRSGAVFVGNFDHDPNVTSCVFLKHEVAPLLEKEKIRFRLVGSNPGKLVRSIPVAGPAAHLFEVTGWVPDTLPYLESARVSVAPILFGAGMNGKIGEAMCAGLPVVTTSLGAQGMNLVHEQHCLVADDPRGFAAAVLRLHENEALWNRLSANAFRHVKALYSEAGVEEALLSSVKKLLGARRPRPAAPALPAPVNFAPPAFPRPPKCPKFSVIVLAHNQWPFTELCLRSLAHAEKAHPGLAEYILVDNASRDGTAQFAGSIPNLRVLAQKSNLGFAAGNNAGIAAARGENVILLNNDTVVPPPWLERFARHVEAIPNLGVLGPSTNTESGQRLPASYQGAGELFAFNEALPAGSWELARKISGLCMVLPRAALDRVGTLDPEFGIGYFEDDDLCLRMEDAGFVLAWAKDVHVHHFGGVSFGKQTLKRARLIEEGMARFAFKWGKRGLEHITKQHAETLLRARRPRPFGF